MKKADAERLLAAYDSDPIAALTTALRIVLDMPDAGWAALIAAAPVNEDRRGILLSHDESSLDQLAAELNEFRSLDTSRH